jgi:hypothetical protein
VVADVASGDYSPATLLRSSKLRCLVNLYLERRSAASKGAPPPYPQTA